MGGVIYGLCLVFVFALWCLYCCARIGEICCFGTFLSGLGLIRVLGFDLISACLGWVLILWGFGISVGVFDACCFDVLRKLEVFGLACYGFFWNLVISRIWLGWVFFSGNLRFCAFFGFLCLVLKFASLCF